MARLVAFSIRYLTVRTFARVCKLPKAKVTNDQPVPFIRINAVSRVFNGGNGVHDLSLDIPRGSFVVLLGPSGCGKSTTLRLIAGLETADQGTIAIDGKDVTSTPPSKRGLSMVFQSYALFPHLSVAENIVFGLKVRKTKKTKSTPA